MGRGGFEPPKVSTDRFTVCCHWPLGNLPIYWSWRLELNPQPADYKSAALPIELHQHINFIRRWCFGAESNHRHGDFQSPALPTELQRQIELLKISPKGIYIFTNIICTKYKSENGDPEGARTLDLQRDRLAF